MIFMRPHLATWRLHTCSDLTEQQRVRDSAAGRPVTLAALSGPLALGSGTRSRRRRRAGYALPLRRSYDSHARTPAEHPYISVGSSLAF